MKGARAVVLLVLTGVVPIASLTAQTIPAPGDRPAAKEASGRPAAKEGEADRAGRRRARPGGGDGPRSVLEAVLQLPEAELIRRIPDKSGLHFVGCPNCDGGAQEQQLDWNPARPESVTCRYCKMEFPNEKFPENRVVRVKNPLGEIQEYPCWESPKPPPRSGWPVVGERTAGYRYFFRAKAWSLARQYYARAAVELANRYAETGDRTYARRAALILDRFARVYPGYCAHYDLPFTPKHIFPGDQGHPFPVSDYRAAKWSWWAFHEIPDDLIRAYDRIRGSGEVDEAMRRRIEDDFFRASVAFVRGYAPQYGNMDPTLLAALITAGKVLREPEYVHEAVRWIDRLTARQFFADGMWREGTLSYHRQTVNGLSNLFALLKGYSDPPGYRHPKDGQHFESLDLASRFPILEKARRIPALLRYPDGSPVVIHDTWPDDSGRGRRPSRADAAAAAAGPLLLAGYGHARLVHGQGGDQVQAHLHFAGGYGHQHNDLLSITLFAQGAERLSDIGYTHTRYRTWAESTLSHNTVMVDGKEQAGGSASRPNDGSLELYVPGDETLQAVEASATRAYPGITREFRRTLVLVGVGPGKSYLVDVFRVAGGGRHEFTLAGDAGHDGSLELELPRTRRGETLVPDGIPIRLPTGESVRGDAGGHNLAYAFVRDVWSSRPSGPWTARFGSAATPEGAVRVHGFTDEGTELIQGRAPSIRRARSDDSLLDRFTMPMLIARREGEDLTSTFVSVIEPTGGEPFVSKVERLAPEGGTSVGVVVRVHWAGGVDTLSFARDPDGPPIRLGDFVAAGRIGFVRERGEGREVGRMTLIGGTRLEKGSRRLAGGGTIRGDVVGVLRKANGAAVDGLVVAGTLPDPARLRGLTVIVRNPRGETQGHRVEAVAEHEGRPILVLADDPALEIDAEGRSQQCFFPGRSWTGTNRFEITTVTSSGAEEGVTKGR